LVADIKNANLNTQRRARRRGFNLNTEDRPHRITGTIEEPPGKFES
jgi:hypothetical protein